MRESGREKKIQEWKPIDERETVSLVLCVSSKKQC